MVSKFELRKKFKAVLQSRLSQSSGQGEAVVESFKKNLKSFFENQKGSWGAFHPLQDEPPLLTALPQISHINWFFPRLQGEVLEFSSDSQTRINELGFREPVAGSVKSVGELDGFLIPGLAFDRSGVRLGRGKGFYDRSLSGTAGLRVGVCFQDQLVEKLDIAEDHDLAMNCILTEYETVTCKSSLKGS